MPTEKREPPAIEIRDANIPHDISIVRQLFEEYAAAQQVDLCFQGFADELATLPGKYSGPRGGIWLAQGDQQLAGCVALRPLDDRRAEMKRLFVRPDFRGLGLGRAMTLRVMEEARHRGYQWLCLDTLPSMADAIKLYRGLGFVEIPPYYDNPVQGALFLARDLSND